MVISGGGGIDFPSGLICIWSGTMDDIPSGWALCDGQDGRPDLRDKFVLGAGEHHTVGETGGEEEVTLTAEQMPNHTHSYTVKAPGSTTVDRGTMVALSSASSSTKTGSTGGSQPHPNMPPYYALCYIIKL